MSKGSSILKSASRMLTTELIWHATVQQPKLEFSLVSWCLVLSLVLVLQQVAVWFVMHRHQLSNRF